MRGAVQAQCKRPNSHGAGPSEDVRTGATHWKAGRARGHAHSHMIGHESCLCLVPRLCQCVQCGRLFPSDRMRRV